MYQFRTGSRFPVPAEDAGAELERIRKQNNGTLQPDIVVDESRPEEAVLHPVFEWDNEVAAEEFRKEQARRVIRSIRVVKEELPEAEPKRVYVNISKTEETARSYYAVTDVVKDPELRAKMIDAAWKELSVFKARYRELIEAANDPQLYKVAQIIAEREYQEAS